MRFVLVAALGTTILASGCAPGGCEKTLVARAWVDRDSNGRREPNEPSLAGVTVRARQGQDGASWGTGTTDERGEAVLAFSYPCGADDWFVYAYPVAGYRPTTPDEVREETALEFGFAPT